LPQTPQVRKLHPLTSKHYIKLAKTLQQCYSAKV
jgi:hypothetical protein